jgi:dienelactone hydrolase
MIKALQLLSGVLIWFCSCFICFVKQGDLKFSAYITSLVPNHYSSDLQVIEDKPEAVLYSLRLFAERNFNLQVQLKDPRIPGKLPAILLLGGMMTGRRAVEYAYNVDSVLLVAPDYPYQARTRYSFLTILSDIPAAQQALHLQIRDNLVLLDYLRKWDRVDTSRISMIGYSFGVPFACATAALDQKLKGLALVYGGAGLKHLLQVNFKLYNSYLNALLIEVFWFFLSDFEPADQAARLKPLPVICLNGEFDAKIPRESAQALHAAIPFTKTVIWLPSEHVHPKNKYLSIEIIKNLKDWYHGHGLD